MAESVELHERVTRVEQKVAEAYFIATKADKEVSEFRAVLNGHTRVLNSLRETQVEQGELLASHDRRLDGLERKVDTGFARMDARFAEVDEGFARMNARFAEVDEGFARMNARFAEVDEGFARMNAKFAQVDEGFRVMESKFAILKAGQDQITELLTAHLGGQSGCAT